MTNQVEIRISAQIAELKSGLNEANKRLDKFEKKVKKGTGEAKKSLIDFQTVASSALGFGLADLSRKGGQMLGEFFVESINLAIKAEQAMQAFEQQAGRTANVLLTDLRSASKGMVSDLNLIQAANRAMALNIDKNQLPELMEVARARSKIMGITVTQAFDDIATGIGRESKLILDNLGIIIDTTQALEDYATENDTTADALDGVQRKQALVNEILRQAENDVIAANLATATMSDDIQVLTAALQNLKEVFGGVITSEMAEFIRSAKIISGAKIIPQEFREESQDLQQEFRDIKTEQDAVLAKIRELNAALAGVFDEALTEKQLELLNEQNTALEAQRKFSGDINDLEGERERIANDIIRAQETGLPQEAIDKIVELKEEQLGYIDILEGTTGKQEEIGSAIDELLVKQQLNTPKFVEAQQKINDSVGGGFKTMEEWTQEIELQKIAITQSIDEQKKKYGELDDALTPVAEKMDKITGSARSASKFEQVKELAKRAIDAIQITTGGGSMELGAGFAERLRARKANNSSTESFDDFVFRPGQKPISFSSQDTLIGVKRPSDIMGGGGGMTVYIDTVQGMDPDELSKALRRELTDKVFA